MSKYHSTITRRDFMKALGLGAAGAATVGVASPIFNDIDELTSSAPKTDNPWWVKKRDFNNPTNTIDWNIFDVLDQRKYPNPGRTHFTPTMLESIIPFVIDNCERKVPGHTTRDIAITFNSYGVETLRTAMGHAWNGVQPMQGPFTAFTAGTQYASWMPPKWQASPEDNVQTMRAALHHFGVNNIGIVELDEKSRKLLQWYMHYDDNTTDGYITNENGGTAVEGSATNQVFMPTTAKYAIAWTTQQNYMFTRNILSKGDFNGGYGWNNVLGLDQFRAYTEGNNLEHIIIRFIQSLGYKVFTQMNRNVKLTDGRGGFTTNDTGMNMTFGIFSGVGELSRSAMMMTPACGVMNRKSSVIFTDMPLAPTNPISFGGVEFCKDCKRCAETCRGEALSLEREGTWNSDPSNGQRPGYFGWRVNWLNCGKGGGNMWCANCLVICPFNHPNDALIHPMVRATTATTSVLNGFFARLDRFMRYTEPCSEKEINNWWYRDYRTFKGDTTIAGGRFNWNL